MAESGLGWEFYLGTLVGAGVGVLAASASAATTAPSSANGDGDDQRLAESAAWWELGRRRGFYQGYKEAGGSTADPELREIVGDHAAFQGPIDYAGMVRRGAPSLLEYASGRKHYLARAADHDRLEPLVDRVLANIKRRSGSR